jgi:hypothetical protein
MAVVLDFLGISDSIKEIRKMNIRKVCKMLMLNNDFSLS